MAKKKKVEEVVEEKKELNLDTVHLLRGVMKISSALNDLDEIMSQEKYYKFRFKQEASKWSKYMEIHTAQLMNSLVEEDSKLLMEIYNSIEESTSKVQMDTPEKTSLIIFFAKISSSLWDIEQMKENRNAFYPRFIEVHTKKVITEIKNQYNSILQVIDSEGKSIDFIVDFFNNFGEKIMRYDNP
jgi:hypothetical protein